MPDQRAASARKGISSAVANALKLLTDLREFHQRQPGRAGGLRGRQVATVQLAIRWIGRA